MRQHPELLRAVSNSLAEGVYALDLEGRLALMNPAAERILGWSEAELLGRNMHEAAHSRRGDGPHVSREDCPLPAVVRSNSVYRNDDDAYTRKDGSTVAAAVTSSPIVSEGRVIGAAVAFRDITERKSLEEGLRAAERRSSFLAEASELLASSLDYETTLASVARLAVPRLADWAAVDMLRPGGELRRLAVEHIDPSKVELAHELWRRYPVRADDAAGVRKVLATGEPEFYPEITDALLRAIAHDGEHLRILRALGLRSGLITPLTARGRVLGAITFVMAESGRAYTREDLSLAEDLSRRAAVAVDNATLVAQVEGERRRLRHLVGSVPGVVWEAWGEPDAASQRINFVSDYAEEMLGYAVEEWLSTPNFWLSIVHPEDRERAAAEARRKFGSEAGGVSEFRWVHKDGRAVPVEAHSVAVRDADGRPVGMRGVTMDVTERRRAQEELDRRARQAALGADVGVALSDSAAPLRAVLQRCAESVVRHLDAAFARVWTLDRGEGVLELQASAGMYTHTYGPHGRVPVGRFKIGLIAEERRPHLTNSVVGDPRVGDQEWARAEGMVSFAGYPLLVDDRLVGVLGMFARKPLPGDTLEALSSVANVIAQGIERRRAEEALAELLREREQTIEEVSTPVVPALEGVLVLPLIGSLDRVRTQRATHAALEAVTRQGARVCIIDITGARVVDSAAVANLTNLVQALRLVGAEACVTGVGANVAQTLVGLGLDMRGLRTYRTLAQALAALLGGEGRRRLISRGQGLN